MNPHAQHEMMKLIASWTLIGAILLTVFITLLSLPGFLAFSDKEQRLKLVFILAAQIALAGITYALGIFQPSPGAAMKAVALPLEESAAKLAQGNGAALAEQARLKSELDAAKSELEETRSQLAASNEKAAGFDQQIVKANANAEAQRVLIARLQDAVQRAAAPPAVVNSEEADALKAQVAKAEMELAESRQIAETLSQRLKDNKSRLSALDQSRRDKERALQRAKAMGRVLAVNPGWNFVVLSIGDKQGVNLDSTLLVLRGGAQIAKLRVKTIEPTQSVADVITSTLRKGTAVQPGDNVIFEDIQNVPGQASSSSRTPTSAQAEADLPLLPSLPR